jgi:hypothetical protein
VNQVVLTALQGANAHYKAKAAAKGNPVWYLSLVTHLYHYLAALSPLERYISEEEARLNHEEGDLGGYKEEVKTLVQLIARFEEPGHIATGSLRKDIGRESSEFKGRPGINVVESVKYNEPTQGTF